MSGYTVYENDPSEIAVEKDRVYYKNNRFGEMVLKLERLTCYAYWVTVKYKTRDISVAIALEKLNMNMCYVY